MNLQQLRSLCEVVDQGLKISNAAEALHRSQPSITRQMQELEQELGIDIFIRNRNRILGITAEGREILALARRVVSDTDTIQSIADDLGRADQGEFTVVATHTQARYVLPPVIREFTRKFPKVKLSLRQGEPAQCCELVAAGQADIAICTMPQDGSEDVVHVPAYLLDRCVIVPAKHPLLRVKPVTLEAIAKYPVINYPEAFTAGWTVSRAFSEMGLKPVVALSAVDADVCKAYVEMGLGVAILSHVSFNATVDSNLRCIDARHVFKPTHMNIVVRRQGYLRGYMQSFLRMFAPHVRKADIDSALRGNVPPLRERLPRAPTLNR